MTILVELTDYTTDRQEVADEILEALQEIGLPVISAKPWSAPVTAAPDPLNFGPL